MTQHGRIILKVASLLLFGVFLEGAPAFAQATLTAAQDPAQHQEWGLWRVMNPKYPRILTRARCDYDVKVDGKWSSWWGYQVRNTYQQGATDYVYLVEYGDPNGQNTFEAPSMIIAAKFEDIDSGGTGLWGTCGQHPLPNALRIRVQCAAPSGQDAPCFKDSSGNPIARAKPSDVDATLHGSGSFSVAEPGKRASNSASKAVHSAERSGLSGTTWSCTENYTLHSRSSFVSRDDSRQGRETVHFNADGTATNSSDLGDSNYSTSHNHWTQSGDNIRWIDTGGDNSDQMEYSGKIAGDTIVFQMNGSRSEGNGAAYKWDGTNTCKKN